MGKNVLQCFPWYKRCKDRGKGRLCPPQPGKGGFLHYKDANCKVPSSEVQPVLRPSIPWTLDGEGGGTRPVYFSHKARVTYRHQMDGNIIDATC